MKMLSSEEGKNRAKLIGIYAVVLLAVLRLVIFPLHSSIKDKQSALEEQEKGNRLKTRLLEKSMQLPEEPDVGKMLTILYSREVSIPEIQTEMLKQLSELAESKGMSITGLETPEVRPGKQLTEIPVVIRLKGRAEALLEFLKTVRTNKKALLFKSMDISSMDNILVISLNLRALRLE